MRQLRDLLCAEHLVVDTNIVNLAGEETPCVKSFVGAKVQASIGTDAAATRSEPWQHGHQ